MSHVPVLCARLYILVDVAVPPKGSVAYCASTFWGVLFFADCVKVPLLPVSRFGLGCPGCHAALMIDQLMLPLGLLMRTIHNAARRVLGIAGTMVLVIAASLWLATLAPSPPPPPAGHDIDADTSSLALMNNQRRGMPPTQRGEMSGEASLWNKKVGSSPSACVHSAAGGHRWAVVVSDACSERFRRWGLAASQPCTVPRTVNQARGDDHDAGADIAWWHALCHAGCTANETSTTPYDALVRQLFPTTRVSSSHLGIEGAANGTMHPTSLWEMNDIPATWTTEHLDAPHDASLVQRHTLLPKSPMCYYRLHNVCVLDGVLTVFLPSPGGGGGGAARSKPLRLCNELRRKLHLHYAAVASNVTMMAVRAQHMAATDADARDGATPRPPRVAHVAACWQYYGFHLFHCLASLFIVQLQHDAFNVDMYLYNHAASLPEASREHFSHQLVMGSAASFLDPSAADHAGHPARKNRSNPYWLLWRQNTNAASRVQEVRRGGPFPGSGPNRCYRRMLVGQPVHHVLTPFQRRFHATVVTSMLRQQLLADGQKAVQRRAQLKVQYQLQDDEAAPPTLRSAPRSNDAGTQTVRVTVVHRGLGRMQGVRRIENLDDVMRALRLHLIAEPATGPSSSLHVGSCAVGAPSTSVLATLSHISGVGTVVLCLVDWAAMDVVAQFALASASHVVIAAHGGGNTWLALQAPFRSAFVELWHAAYVPRNVFESMAHAYGIRYLAHLRPDVRDPGNFMHRNVVVDIPQLLALVSDGLRYAARPTTCGKS